MEHSHRREQCSISSMAHDNGFYNYDFFLQNGSSNDQKQRDVFVSCLSPWSWADKCSYSSWHPLHHAAMVAIESSAERDLQLFPSTSNGEDKASDLDHALYSAGFPAKRQKTKAVEDEEKQFACPVECKLEKPYLCTGYDIFLVWEPCVMCAMALVHQRVRRIFYAFPNASTGALGSVQRLQGEKSLNHHYAAFRIFIPQDYLISAFSVA
ncbi:hypothetical protein SAY86_013875 [Trapa natans]|uniref:CMP/dCMP-type deaminase domain-containing protein n=1 Tax=Trapa natans TaxID=22666 RepID=A0AAN7QQW1_TRANT|nr:hypothetical protein SAY86_013875 [Trapa natans]